MSVRADEPFVATMVSTLFFFSAAELAWDWVSMVTVHSSRPHGDWATVEKETCTTRCISMLVFFRTVSSLSTHSFQPYHTLSSVHNNSVATSAAHSKVGFKVPGRLSHEVM